MRTNTTRVKNTPLPERPFSLVSAPADATLPGSDCVQQRQMGDLSLAVAAASLSQVQRQFSSSLISERRLMAVVGMGDGQHHRSGG